MLLKSFNYIIFSVKSLPHELISYHDMYLDDVYVGFSWRKQQNSDDRYKEKVVTFWYFLSLYVFSYLLGMLQHVLVLLTQMLKRH